MRISAAVLEGEAGDVLEVKEGCSDDVFYMLVEGEGLSKDVRGCPSCGAVITQQKCPLSGISQLFYMRVSAQESIIHPLKVLEWRRHNRPRLRPA